MAAKAKSKMPGSRTVSVKGLVDDINALLKVIDKSSATRLKKKRASLLLESILGLIMAFCLADARRMDLAETEFEVRRRGKKK
jgi:hypothetical protein